MCTGLSLRTFALRCIWFCAPSTTRSLSKLYFDAATGLLSRRDMVYGTTPVQHYYEDYREIDGIKLPFLMRSEGPVRVITRLTEIKHNVPIDDAKFKTPVN